MSVGGGRYGGPVEPPDNPRVEERLSLGGVGALDLDLDVFSGPFDLLLTLVLREEVDLLELELAEVVLAYLDHLVRYFGKSHVVADEKQLVVPVVGHFFAAVVDGSEGLGEIFPPRRVEVRRIHHPRADPPLRLRRSDRAPHPGPSA